MQYEFAKESYRRALEASQNGYFKDEIVRVESASKKGPATVVSEDEEPKRGDPSKFDGLKPSFEKDGTITAANASSLADGAAMVIVVSREFAERNKLQPLATITGYGGAAQTPEGFTNAPALPHAESVSKTS